MNRKWQVRDANDRFGEMLEASLTEGPQIVIEGGVETAVLLPIDQWKRLQKTAKPTLKELLLAPEARTESLTPPRPKHHYHTSECLD